MFIYHIGLPYFHSALTPKTDKRQVGSEERSKNLERDISQGIKDKKNRRVTMKRGEKSMSSHIFV